MCVLCVYTRKPLLSTVLKVQLLTKPLEVVEAEKMGIAREEKEGEGKFYAIIKILLLLTWIKPQFQPVNYF